MLLKTVWQAHLLHNLQCLLDSDLWIDKLPVDCLNSNVKVTHLGFVHLHPHAVAVIVLNACLQTLDLLMQELLSFEGQCLSHITQQTYRRACLE